MSEPLSVEYLELIKERWARWAAAGLPVSKDRQDLMAEVERLRGEVARQAEQITAIRALADDWRDFGDVTIHMDDAAADIDAALEPTS